MVAAIKTQCEPYGVPLLNLNDAVPDELFIDGGHLKEEGDMIVAERLYQFITANFPELRK